MGAAGRGMVRAWLERDRERVGGGPGVYRADTTRYYLLRDDSWKTDIVPEVLDGKNVADFVDPDILERLLALEAEEEGLLAAEASAAGDEESDEDQETATMHKLMLAKKSALQRKRIATRNSSGFVLPNSAKLRHRTADDMEEGLLALGYNAATAAAASASAPTRGRKRERNGQPPREATAEGGNENEDGEGEGDGEDDRPVKRAARSASATARGAVLAQKFGGDAKARVRGISKASRAPSVKSAHADGFEDEETRASNLKKQQKYRSIEFHGSKGEKDHIITAKLPKWLFSGKMGFSRDRR